MNSENSIKETLRKIAVLAEAGREGERQVAQAKLEALLKKHNLSMADVVDETKGEVFWPYRTKYEKKLLLQLIYSICDDLSMKYYTSTHRSIIGAKVTRLQAVEIDVQYAAYRKALEKGFENFYSAFVAKNHIYPPSAGSRPCTDADLEILAMADAISKTEIRKALPHATF